MLIHLKDLLRIPKKTYVRLKDGFRERLFDAARKNLDCRLYTLAKIINRQFGINCSNTLYYWYNGKRRNRDYSKIIPSAMPLEIVVFLAEIAKIDMAEVERNINFIKGDTRAARIFDPKFPVELNKTTAAVIGHTLHDGYLAERLRVVYANKERDNLEHFKQTVTEMFGASKVEFGEIKSKGGYRIDAPNIVGYFLFIFGLKPGDKLKVDAQVPPCLLKAKNINTISGYIESVITDEANIAKHSSQVGGYIKIELSSASSRPSRLLVDDRKMFEKMGIRPCKINLVSVKKTKVGEQRYKWNFIISGRRNLLSLHSLIKIPTMRKERVFDKIVKSYSKLGDAVLLTENLRNKLFNRAITKHGDRDNLAKHLTEQLGFSISTASIYDWSKGRYHCPITVIAYLAETGGHSMESIVQGIITYKSNKNERPFRPQATYLRKVFNII